MVAWSDEYARTRLRKVIYALSSVTQIDLDQLWREESPRDFATTYSRLSLCAPLKIVHLIQHIRTPQDSELARLPRGATKKGVDDLAAIINARLPRPMHVSAQLIDFLNACNLDWTIIQNTVFSGIENNSLEPPFETLYQLNPSVRPDNPNLSTFRNHSNVLALRIRLESLIRITIRLIELNNIRTNSTGYEFMNVDFDPDVLEAILRLARQTTTILNSATPDEPTNFFWICSLDPSPNRTPYLVYRYSSRTICDVVDRVISPSNLFEQIAHTVICTTVVFSFCGPTLD